MWVSVSVWGWLVCWVRCWGGYSTTDPLGCSHHCGGGLEHATGRLCLCVVSSFLHQQISVGFFHFLSHCSWAALVPRTWPVLRSWKWQRKGKKRKGQNDWKWRATNVIYGTGVQFETRTLWIPLAMQVLLRVKEPTVRRTDLLNCKTEWM